MGFASKHRLALNCVITNDNFDEIPEIFIFCRRNNIIPWIETVTITGRATDEMIISKDKIAILYKHLADIDRDMFGFEREPDSPIVGADRRRYKHVCQIDMYGNLYHTDAYMTDEVGNVRTAPIKELLLSEKFQNLRKADKHSKHFLHDDYDVLVSGIYKIVTSRNFRAGPLPSEQAKGLILDKIKSKILHNEPIELLQFWGGCKNQNLSVEHADLCEEATLDNLYQLHLEVQKIYSSGLSICICPGDARVERVNGIPHEKTMKYVQSLGILAAQEKYHGVFSMLPISELYEEYSTAFDTTLSAIKESL